MLLLLVVLIGTLLYPIESLEKAPSLTLVDSEKPVEPSLQPHTCKNNEHPIVIEGQFIIDEGNSDHLFRPSDFIKEEAFELDEGDTKHTKKNG